MDRPVSLTQLALDAGLPILRGWRSRQSAFGIPLLHKDHAEAAIDSFLTGSPRRPPPQCCFPMVASNSRFAALLAGRAERLGFGLARFGRA